MLQHAVFLGDGVAVFDRGGIRHGRARGQRVGGIVGDIGDQQRYLLSCGGSDRHPSTLDGREMLANGVDLGNGRAGVHQRLVGGDQILQRNFVVNRLLYDR